MVVPLFPTVAGLKIEDAWRRRPREMVRCTARLSRPLLPKESKRVERFLNASVNGVEVVHECRRDALEEWMTRLLETLAGKPTWADARVAAVGIRRHREAGPKEPGPAA